MGSPFASKSRKNPIHGMSMALHSSFSSNEIPPASQLREKASKVGHLKKLSGKGILTSGTWRDRFCLLVKTKLYFYENEKSEGTEKSCGFVNLEYFDTCTEATTRMTRKATNVFVIGSTEKGFFESHSGRHYFAAETVTEMKDWVNAINSAMNHIRGKEKRTRDGSLTPAPGLNKKDSLNSKSKQPAANEDDTNGTLPRSGDRLDHVTKGRPKGPQGRRLPRKSHLGRASGISDSRPEAVDSLVDSDEDVRDSRGRATSLSALEASSVTHPNTKQSNSSSNGHVGDESKVGRGGKENFDSWSNASGDSDMVDSLEMDLVYKYSSSEDSDEENRIPLSKSGRGRLTRSPNLGSGSYIQNRSSGRGSHRGSTPLRNSSVTPPPCVLRKFRREQNGLALINNGNSSSSGLKSKIGKEPDRNASPVNLPDADMKPQRTSSGSSLSTLTADTYVSNNMTMMGLYGKQNSFSSLQRIGRKNNGGSGSNSSACGSHRPTSSANASPLLGNNSYLPNGHCYYPNSGANPSSSSTHSPSGTFERNAGSTARAFHLERTMHSISKELEVVAQETKQLDHEVAGVKLDVGTVQDNLATVRTYVDSTKDRVSKLQSQVGHIEKQVASVVKEAQNMRDQAKKLLEMAENSKVTHDNLLEEAEHLVNFLRQSTSCMSGPYHHQHTHARPPFQPSCCSSNNSSGSGSQFYGITNGTNGPVTSLRRKSKTPDRNLDSDPEMELLDETQTQMENIIAKHRKSKALLSASSSSGSGGSNHILSSNRNSMIEIGDNGRSINNNRSPKADGRC